MSWRDRLGRFTRLAARVETSSSRPAPELSPMVAKAIGWLADQPDAAARLRGLHQPQVRAAERVARHDIDEPVAAAPTTEPATANPLTRLLAKAAALGDERPERNQELARLHKDGWSTEGLTAVAQMAAENGISLGQAAEALDRATVAEPVASSRRRIFVDERDQRDQREAAKAYEQLLAGNDEEFLASTIRSTLRAERGQ